MKNRLIGRSTSSSISGLLLAAALCGCGVSESEPDELGSLAQMIVAGTVDSTNIYKNVGALIRPISTGWWEDCSGTLLSPTVFLTAAHCSPGETDGAKKWVTFEPAITASSVVYEGKLVVNPAYRETVYDKEDIALVILDKPVPQIAPAALAREGYLDALKSSGQLVASTQFVSVGYGVWRTNSGGPPEFPFDDKRRYGTLVYNSINKAWVHLNQNSSNSDVDGACFGDSGGPNFHNGKLVGTTIGGDMACGSTNVILRMDTPSARAFIGTYVKL